MRDKVRRLLHVFSTFKVGGPQRRFAHIVDALGPTLCHTIVSMDDRWEAWDLLPESADCQRGKFQPAGTNSFKTIRDARRYLNQTSPDLLVTYNWGAIEWAAANKPAICSHIHIEDGFRPDEIEKRKWHRNLFRRLMLGKNSKVVVISETMKAIALNEWWLPKSRVLFIPNGIPLEKFAHPASPRTRNDLNIRADEVVVGTVAALRPEKDLKTLISAVSKVDDALNIRLIIGGDGPERADLEAYASQSKSARPVVFLGHESKPETIYPLFDIFGLSSQTEQMPLSILEAMAAGLPVAGFSVGDVAKMVSPANAPFVVDRGEEALAAAISQLAADAALRERIGQANHDEARRDYSDQTMLDHYQTLLCE